MTSEPGSLYLLHFEPPYGHARHYLGWTAGPIEERIRRHEAGFGATLLRRARAAGVRFILAWSAPGDRAAERVLKDRGSLRRVCPICRELALAEQAAARRERYRARRAAGVPPTEC